MAEGTKFGDIEHSWPDGAYTIRFSYQAIDAIEHEFGEDWSERLRDLFVGKTKRDLEFVTARRWMQCAALHRRLCRSSTRYITRGSSPGTVKSRSRTRRRQRNPKKSSWP